MSQTAISGLYLLTEPCRDLLERVTVALRHGVKIVQYRHKDPDREEPRHLAKQLNDLCRQHQALFIVNDDPLTALAWQADGVHLGQQDGSVSEARQILGDQALIGRSTHSVIEAVQAEQEGADYIGFGCLFSTTSKPDTVAASLEELRRVRHAVSLPIVAIGGIHAGNLSLAVAAGADSVAVISAVMRADDCQAAVLELQRQYRLGCALRG